MKILLLGKISNYCIRILSISYFLLSNTINKTIIVLLKKIIKKEKRKKYIKKEKRKKNKRKRITEKQGKGVREARQAREAREARVASNV